jgi:hypothetical protein
MRLLVMSLFLFGCGTSYRASNHTSDGGYSELRLNDRAYQVYFTGKGTSTKDAAHRYALRRAAQLTVQHGFAGFLVNDDQTRAQVDTFGGVASTAQLTIRMLTAEEVAQAPPQLIVYDPRLVLKQVDTPSSRAPVTVPPAAPPSAKRAACGEPGAPC